MCGIYGITTQKASLVQQMMDQNIHRGPDGDGLFFNEFITIGHRLLSITDQPQASKQPWILGHHIIAFNGEIYNYQDLKNDLIQRGCVFKTDSDTEVLAHGLNEYGKIFIKRLEGMFALAWYNSKKQTLILSRDPTGAKPLYYLSDQGKLLFASEIKPLLKATGFNKIDKLAFSLYKSFGYVPGPKTMYEGISKLIPGEMIEYDLKNQNILSKSTFNHQITDDQFYSYKDFRKKTSKAIKKCLMGRREIGLFLSGGLDSSIVLHELCTYQTKPKTFTTFFETKLDHQYGQFDNDTQILMSKTKHVNDDADTARKLSKLYNTEHHQLLINETMFADAIIPTVRTLEEPRLNKSTAAYYLLNQFMAKNGIVVTLSGDGGDEMMCGYPRHFALKENKTTAATKNIAETWFDLTAISALKTDFFKSNANLASKEEIVSYIRSYMPNLGLPMDYINKFMYYETYNHLPEDFLIRNDKLGMNFSMEGRFPLLIDSYKKYCLGINSKVKLGEDYSLENKLCMRNAYKNILPDYIIQKSKTGWTSPAEWYLNKNGRIYEMIHECLKPSYHPTMHEILDVNKDIHEKGFFTIFYLLLWAKEFNMEL